MENIFKIYFQQWIFGFCKLILFNTNIWGNVKSPWEQVWIYIFFYSERIELMSFYGISTFFLLKDRAAKANFPWVSISSLWLMTCGNVLCFGTCEQKKKLSTKLSSTLRLSLYIKYFPRENQNQIFSFFLTKKLHRRIKIFHFLSKYKCYGKKNCKYCLVLNL